MEHRKAYNPLGNIQPYVPPVVQKFSHYRTADNSRVFFVLDVNTVDFAVPHVMYIEIGQELPTSQPYSLWVKGLADFLLKRMSPAEVLALFIDHKNKVA